MMILIDLLHEEYEDLAKSARLLRVTPETLAAALLTSPSVGEMLGDEHNLRGVLELLAQRHAAGDDPKQLLL